MKKVGKVLTTLCLSLACILTSFGVVNAESSPEDLSAYGATYVEPKDFGTLAYFGWGSPVLDSKDITSLCVSEDEYDSTKDYEVNIPLKNCKAAFYSGADGIAKLPSNSGYVESDTVESIIRGNSSLTNTTGIKVPFNVVGDTYSDAMSKFKSLYIYILDGENKYTVVKVSDFIKYASFFDDSKVSYSGSVSKIDENTARLSITYDFTSIDCTLDSISIRDGSTVIKSEYIDSDKKKSKGTINVDFSVEENGTYSYTLENGVKSYSGDVAVDWITENNPVVPESPEDIKVKSSVAYNDDKSIATITVKTAIPCEISIASVPAGEYTKEFSYSVSENGDYSYVATTDKGGVVEGTVTVDGIKNKDDDARRDPYDTWGGEGNDDILAQTGIEIPVYIYIISILCVISFAGIILFRKRKVGVQNEESKN